MRLRASILLAAWGVLPLAAQEVRILPANPHAGEAFAVIGAFDLNRFAYFTASSARVEGGSIEITQPRRVGSGPPQGLSTFQWSRYGANVAGLGAGTYTVRAAPFRADDSAFPGYTPPVTLPVTVLSGSAATPQYRELDGNWFDTAQPGWGVNIVQGESGALFGIWLTYAERNFQNAADFDAEWIVMPAGRWMSPTVFRGLIYESVGTRMNETPASTHLTPVGLATLEFLAPDRVKFSVARASNVGKWTESEWTLRRFVF